jgi:hypothetical protein
MRKTRSTYRASLLPRAIAAAAAIAFCGRSLAAESPSATDSVVIGAQLRHLKQSEVSERRRVERDEKLIEQLQRRLEQLEHQNHSLQETSKQIQAKNAQSNISLTERVQHLQDQVATNSNNNFQFDSGMSRYLGAHQFTLAGDAAGSFIYDRHTAQNTFSLTFQPIILYRPNDWILFEGSIAASLPRGTGATFSLPVATAQIFLNHYLEVNAGIFDQPFGDWYEDQSPLWVNRFITAPLPYGAEALIPPTDIGVQLRGSVQWGQLGQDVDYTTWIANGPSFDSSLPRPSVGQSLSPQNNVALNTNGRA